MCTTCEIVKLETKFDDPSCMSCWAGVQIQKYRIWLLSPWKVGQGQPSPILHCAFVQVFNLCKMGTNTVSHFLGIEHSKYGPIYGKPHTQPNLYTWPACPYHQCGSLYHRIVVECVCSGVCPEQQFCMLLPTGSMVHMPGEAIWIAAISVQCTASKIKKHNCIDHKAHDK